MFQHLSVFSATFRDSTDCHQLDSTWIIFCFLLLDMSWSLLVLLNLFFALFFKTSLFLRWRNWISTSGVASTAAVAVTRARAWNSASAAPRPRHRIPRIPGTRGGQGIGWPSGGRVLITCIYIYIISIYNIYIYYIYIYNIYIIYIYIIYILYVLILENIRKYQNRADTIC